MAFDIPEYDTALRNLIAEAQFGLSSTDQLLGQVQRRRTRHPGPIRNVAGPQSVDETIEAHEQSVSVLVETVKESRIEDFVMHICDLAEQLKKQQIQTLIRTVDRVTTATGNIVKGDGKQFSYDTYLDALEKIEIAFDENDIPKLPTMVAGPEVAKQIAQTLPTNEQAERLNRILLEKKAKHNAEKRARRLSVCA